MANIFLDYAVPFSQVESLPPPSFGFLHKIGVVVPMDDGSTPSDITLVTDATELTGLTTHAAEIQALFDAGLSQVYLIRVLDIAELDTMVAGMESDFYTLYCTQSFPVADFVTNSASWTGVRGSVSNSTADSVNAAEKDFVLFGHKGAAPLSYNPLYAFGKLLSSASWRNQQYLATSHTEGLVDTLGMAEALFDERVSFWMTDEDYGNRLGFFVAGGKSVTTPYIAKEVELNMQFEMANWIAINQPFNTSVQRASLERIGNKVMADYVERGYLDGDAINELKVTDSEEVFVVKGNLTLAPSVAMWRMKVDAFQTQG